MTFALSDLVRGLVVLSVHPRQAEVAPGAAKAFGFSIPAGVHETDMPKYLGNVRCWVNSGKHLLSLSFSGFDPKETSRIPSLDDHKCYSFAIKCGRRRGQGGPCETEKQGRI